MPFKKKMKIPYYVNACEKHSLKQENIQEESLRKNLRNAKNNNNNFIFYTKTVDYLCLR